MVSVFTEFRFWFVHTICEENGSVVKMVPNHWVGAMYGCRRTYLIPWNPVGLFFQEVAKWPRGPEPQRSRFNAFSHSWFWALFGCVSHHFFLCVWVVFFGGGSTKPQHNKIREYFFFWWGCFLSIASLHIDNKLVSRFLKCVLCFAFFWGILFVGWSL